MAAPRVPAATYRLQFHPGFRFADARALVPYLDRLGITDLYASPLLAARRGSPHGYDVTDPSRLNSDLGTEEEFDALTRALQSHGMGLLLDIVPNHMAASPENPWWGDVLAHGPASPFAPFFDIDWHPPDPALENRLLLPILGAPYRSVLENGELAVTLHEGGFSLRHHGTVLPLAFRSWGGILAHRLDRLEEVLGSVHPAVRGLRELVAATLRLPDLPEADPEAARQRRLEEERLKGRLRRLTQGHAQVQAFLDENLRIFNGTKGDPGSFGLLDRLLGEQAYRLCFWAAANERINYRRFFALSDLVGVRVEDPRVFEAVHALLLRLAAEGRVTGFRVDHVDGLADPLAYLRRLRERLPGGCSIVVEKILTGDEALPAEWPVHGTTGYEFLNVLNGVFVDPRGLETLQAIYARFIGSGAAFEEVVHEKKTHVLATLFRAEMRALARELGRLAEQDRDARALPREDLAQALREVIACFPVYRTYIRDVAVSRADRRAVTRALAEARGRSPHLSAVAFAFLRRVLLLTASAARPAGSREGRLRFVRRWQQATGAITAKGVEDTAFYVYNPLVSLNEVGGDPRVPEVPVEAFHGRLRARRARWPFTLNATSTHDTNRSEDVRARINVLSEMPDAWEGCLQRWSRWNRAKKRLVDGRSVPDANEEVLLYQTLVGAWPLREGEMPAFRERLRAYVVKAAREAGVHTGWIRPHAEYERALEQFVDALLTASPRDRFGKDFERFRKRVAHYGAIGALGQVLLKIAAPGIPDFYQGTELWAFRLVDPDNRSPVDFAERRRLLEELTGEEPGGLTALAREVLSRWADGRAKLYVTSRALRCRRANPDLFARGDYIPLHAPGARADHVCAFARRRGRAWALVAVPRLLTRLVRPGGFPLGRRVWGATALVLPQGAPKQWRSVLTGEVLGVSRMGGKTVLRLALAFQTFPGALLTGSAPRAAGAGSGRAVRRPIARRPSRRGR